MAQKWRKTVYVPSIPNICSCSLKICVYGNISRHRTGRQTDCSQQTSPQLGYPLPEAQHGCTRVLTWLAMRDLSGGWMVEYKFRRWSWQLLGSSTAIRYFFSVYKARLAFFHVHYTTLLHLPPITFHCIGGELIRSIICSSSTSFTRQYASAAPRPLLSRAGSGDDRGRSSSYFLILLLILIFKIISNHSQANPKHNDFEVRNSFNKMAMKIFCLALVQLKELHCKDTKPKIRNKYSQKRNCEASVPISTCVCERFIYSQDRSAYSAAGKYVDWSWEFINRSQTNEFGNWDCGRTIPFLGVHK